MEWIRALAPTRTDPRKIRLLGSSQRVGARSGPVAALVGQLARESSLYADGTVTNNAPHRHRRNQGLLHG